MQLYQTCQTALNVLLYNLKQSMPESSFRELEKYIPVEPCLDKNSVIQERDIERANEIALGRENITEPVDQLASLFANINLTQKDSCQNTDSHYYYPILPLRPDTIFPSREKSVNPEEERSKLWSDFVKGLEKISDSHKNNLSLWLDHFDTALQCFTANLISSKDQHISFYDQTKTTAALATALAFVDPTEASPFLLIQGDFFGIQDFIFSEGRETNKQAAKLLRGRSFQVSLFTELAALKVLETLELPSTSQLMNAAGKFLIVAPNIEDVRQKIVQVQQELNAWFVEHTYGLVGLGLVTEEASENDFLINNFTQLVKRLFRKLEMAKLQRLDLTESTPSVQTVSYPFGACPYNKYFPAQAEKTNKDTYEDIASLISQDQINIGKYLVTKRRIIICSENAEIYSDNCTNILNLSIFGYRIIFTDNEEISGKFSLPAKAQQIKRLWDFELPQNTQQAVWNGYARRYINAYIPYFGCDQSVDKEKYKNVEEPGKKHAIKTFDYLACEDRQLLSNNQGYVGQAALMTLKGDVDNLGLIFQNGLENANFAKITALSRQLNLFFSLWLPAYCAEHNPNMYTVFAGGDDFFLIGPWHSTQKLAYEMQHRFAQYVANNEQLHFSAGMVMTKVGVPVPRMGDMAEEALEQAKAVAGKNAVTIYQQSLKWQNFEVLCKLEEEIERLASEYHISTSYLYSLIQFAQQAENTEKHIESSMWRSRFYYRTVRYVIDKLKPELRQHALNQISTSLGELGLATHKENFIIPLFNYFYLNRK